MSRPRRSGKLRAGRIIGVVHRPFANMRPVLMKARVLRATAGGRVAWRLVQQKFYAGHVLFEDEGTTWIRDWKSLEADALRAALAL